MQGGFCAISKPKPWGGEHFNRTAASVSVIRRVLSLLKTPSPLPRLHLLRPENSMDLMLLILCTITIMRAMDMPPGYQTFGTWWRHSTFQFSDTTPMYQTCGKWLRCSSIEF